LGEKKGNLGGILLRVGGREGKVQGEQQEDCHEGEVTAGGLGEERVSVGREGMRCICFLKVLKHEKKEKKTY